MSATLLPLPQEPSDALQTILDTSREQPVLVFKKSPTCPISHHAEDQFRTWLANAQGVRYAEIDVIEQRPLARGLTEALGIEHQSPQALFIVQGEVLWHDSHMQLHVDQFDRVLEEAKGRLAGT